MARLPYGESSFRQLYDNYQTKAAKRRLIFELTVDEFRALTRQDCFICGRPPANSYLHDRSSNGEYTYSGIDRMDNNQGYTTENCVPCCKHCNFAKGKGSLEELMLYIYDAYNHCIAPALITDEEEE